MRPVRPSGGHEPGDHPVVALGNDRRSVRPEGQATEGAR